MSLPMTLRTASRSAIAALFLLGAAAPAMAQQLVDATEPQRILATAKSFGTAELGQEKDGDPKITGRMDGTRYAVHFYGCTEGKRCRSIQLGAGFSLDSKPTLDEVNAFNAKHRFLKVYIDKEGDPIVEMDVNLDGGVSTKNLDDTFDWFKTVVRSFRQTFMTGS